MKINFCPPYKSFLNQLLLTKKNPKGTLKINRNNNPTQPCLRDREAVKTEKRTQKKKKTSQSWLLLIEYSIKIEKRSINSNLFSSWPLKKKSWLKRTIKAKLSAQEGFF